MNQFAVKPELAPIVLPEFWECPITGLVVPKNPAANLQWRAELLEEAERDEPLRVELYTAASQSLLFWINGFGFTLRIFEPAASGEIRQAEYAHLPFVTWPIQDEHILRIEHAIDCGDSLLTDKSRDMGATWDHIAILVHRLIFRPDESHLIISRKEDAVDILDGTPKGYPHGPLADPGTLFGKVDYILARLPEWMLPRLARKKLHLVNLDGRSRIDGESANATAGSSDRRTSIFLDEFAKVDEAESIKRSTKDVTACRLVCSTPNGAGTTFSKWRNSGQIPVMILPWWEHPEKGAGRYAAEDDLGRWKIRSSWYDIQCEQRSPKEVAIELDMDHVGSGDTFFEGSIVEQHKKLFARLPKNQFSIFFKKNLTDDAIRIALERADMAKVDRAGKGRWRIWAALNEETRLDQTFTYTMACDIGLGQGASNSVCSVMCDQTREKVAEYANANIPPYEFAKAICAAAIWVGGRNKRPLIIWESNGVPGFDFERQLVRVYRYPSIWFDRQAGTLGEKVTKRFGWHSTTAKKAAVLGALRRAYAHGGFTNHSREALDEALTYIQYEGGGIGPAELVKEPEAARAAHGDRVIADALCLVPHEPQLREPAEDRGGGLRTFGGRMAEAMREKKLLKSGKRFNFELETA